MALIDLLPADYLKSDFMVALQNALDYWATKIQADRDDVMLQLSVNTATWGLTYFEKLFGIATDVTLPYNIRRSKIISKIRGSGTTTIELLKSVTESFANGDVDVLEHPDTYSFEIVFSSAYGVPANVNDMITAIDDIEPAHLAWKVIYVYMTWEQFDNYNHTWDAWENLGLNWYQFETHSEGLPVSNKPINTAVYPYVVGLQSIKL